MATGPHHRWFQPGAEDMTVGNDVGAAAPAHSLAADDHDAGERISVSYATSYPGGLPGGATAVGIPGSDALAWGRGVRAAGW